MALRQVSQQQGISEATLHKWRTETRGTGQLLPDADAGPEGWSSRDTFAAVLETAALNEADLAEYCRERGLYPSQIGAWRVACEQANDRDRASTARMSPATKDEKTRIKELERACPQGPRLGRNRSTSGSQKKGGSDLGGDEDAGSAPHIAKPPLF